MIKYILGDITKPIGIGARIIIQCNNDIGKYGAGVSGAISRKWPIVESDYRKWFASKVDFELGSLRLIAVEKDIYVGNFIGQKGIRHKDNVKPVRYEAFEIAFDKLYYAAKQLKAEIHSPMVGAGLAGGDWNIIEGIFNDKLVSKGVDVIIYRF